MKSEKTKNIGAATLRGRMAKFAAKSVLYRAIWSCISWFMAGRKQVPSKIRKAIWQQFNSQCAFCFNDDVKILEIHHINEYATSQDNAEDNLILVCPNCHRSDITIHQMYRRKIDAIKGKLNEIKNSQQGSNVIQFHPDSVKNSTIIAGNNVTIKKTSGMSVKSMPPVGSIGSDLSKCNYIKYLIDRYHQFKKADQNIQNMNYAILYSSIKRKFGAKWDMVPVKRFEDLSQFLQGRIDNTILGKSNRNKGVRSYDDFMKTK